MMIQQLWPMTWESRFMLSPADGANMMQLLIHVKGKQLHVLVDSGSTHSFIHEAVVHALGPRCHALTRINSEGGQRGMPP
jgi:hypothetical protein